MLARIHKSMDEKDQGFTLIELLVVMIIIGILAAIAIPVFLSQRAKARDSSTKSDVSTLGKEIATYYVDGTNDLAVAQAGGAGGDITISDTDDGGSYSETFHMSNGTTLNSVSGDLVDSTNWCVALTNADGSVEDFEYSVDGGLADGAC
jgi:prepilin-type N-terminal cleavage/methylation domain-containing protein